LTVSDELDDALMVGLVRVFVKAMMKCIRVGKGLERQIQPKHQRNSENLALGSQDLDDFRNHDSQI
jgi:hypothetical protein